jgi:hypothetical protein
MSYRCKPNEVEARERLKAFWNREKVDRPGLGVTIVEGGRREPALPTEWSNAKETDLLPERHAKLCDQFTRGRAFLAEAMPAHHVAWASLLCTLPVFAGGDYEYHDSAWVKAWPEVYDATPATFDPESQITKKLERCYIAAAEAVGDRGYVTPPLMLDGLTTLSMFRGTDQLCMDMQDCPETVRKFSSAFTRLYCDIYEHYYQLLLGLGGRGDSICFGGPTAEGRTEGVQCDFAVNLSVGMFEQFVLPDLLTVTEYMDRSLYHLDGTCQLRFLDSLRKCPKLDGIQWNPETTASDPLKWLDAFRDIRARDFCLYLWCGVDQAVEITRAIGPSGLFINLPSFATAKDAEDAIARIERAAK